MGECQKQQGRIRATLLRFLIQQRLAVASALPATGTAAAAATTAATTLLAAGRTVATLRSGSAGCSGHCLFGFIRLRLHLVVDVEVFFLIVVEVGSALEGDGVLGRRALALGTRCAFGAVLIS